MAAQNNSSLAYVFPDPDLINFYAEHQGAMPFVLVFKDKKSAHAATLRALKEAARQLKASQQEEVAAKAALKTLTQTVADTAKAAAEGAVAAVLSARLGNGLSPSSSCKTPKAVRSSTPAAPVRKTPPASRFDNKPSKKESPASTGFPSSFSFYSPAMDTGTPPSPRGHIRRRWEANRQWTKSNGDAEGNPQPHKRLKTGKESTYPSGGGGPRRRRPRS